jgi:hypothetical protein
MFVDVALSSTQIFRLEPPILGFAVTHTNDRRNSPQNASGQNADQE